MSLASWIRNHLGRRGGTWPPGPAGSRATGGEPDPAMPDRHSTTGTTPSETYVGRDSGDTAGDTGTTGAERRTDADTDEQGANRDEPDR